MIPGRIPSLDGLRALSIVLVIIAHFAGTAHLPKSFEPIEHLGNYGVRFFFVISGFLITTLLLKEYAKTKSVSLRHFYIRRCLRILPAFYVYVGSIVVLTAIGLITLYPGDLLHALTYTMNYQNIPVDIPNGRANGWYLTHLWSLSVEEQFYLLWPLLFLLLRPRRALTLAGFVILLAPVLRAAMWRHLSPAGFDIVTTAVSRQFEAVADALATGCLLAGLYNWLGASQPYQAFARSKYFALVLLIGGVLPSLTYIKTPSVFWVLSQSALN
jgi:peptidoglycan/LPS O-acetylase OafA/YrhL